MELITAYLALSLIVMFAFHSSHPAMLRARPYWFQVGHSFSFLNVIMAMIVACIWGIFLK